MNAHSPTTNADASASRSSAQTGATMDTMIRVVKVAREAFADACRARDINPGPATDAAFHAAAKTSDAAVEALLRHRPATVEEYGDRLTWLWGFDGPWNGVFPSSKEIALLLGSTGSATAAHASRLPHGKSSAQTGEATAEADDSISGALDELAYARAEALITIHLLESELVRNPKEPGYTWGLTMEQQDMLHHVAALVHASIGRAIDKLEAAR